jgi:rhodanese-related sulfurtransferase
MKKLNVFKTLALAGIVSVFGLTSCVETIQTPVVDNYKTLTDYMKANSLDLNNMTTNWVIDAPSVNTRGIANYYFLDLRSAADFSTGHIQGAVNTTMANVLTAAAAVPVAKKDSIIVVCYTGQTAAWANVALRLSGYPKSRILKWGMSSWNTIFDRNTANISNQGTGNANWSTTNTIKTPVTFGLPTITTTQTTGAAILSERVAYILTKGLQLVNAADVLATPSNYFINNYWTDANVNQYGHIKGAYRLNETLTLAADGMKNLDPAAQIVTYCWTGQTSALVSAYLNVLGYNAWSLKFGANSMINAALTTNKWSSATPGSYAYVTGAN